MEQEGARRSKSGEKSRKRPEKKNYNDKLVSDVSW
jgi:hypothetical protein